MRQLYLLSAAAVGAAVWILMYMTVWYANGTIGFLRKAGLEEEPSARTAENVETWADRSLGYVDFYQRMSWCLAFLVIASLILNYYLAGRVAHFRDIAHGLGHGEESENGSGVSAANKNAEQDADDQLPARAESKNL